MPSAAAALLAAALARPAMGGSHITDDVLVDLDDYPECRPKPPV